MNKTSQTSTGRALIVDDHDRARESMADILEIAGYEVSTAASAVEALRALERRAFEVIVTDLKMPGMSGIEFIRELSHQGSQAPVVMITAHATVATAVEAMRLGAFDFIEKPFQAEQLEDLVGRALEQHRGSVETISSAMVGASAPMKSLRQRIAQVAATDETVLITGESGVGKELVAGAIHRASRREAGPLVCVNCPALSPQLMESELFGHARGAFTSAEAPRIGRFEMAHQGTLLLDEVTEIDLPLQAKLLRVLQERSFERVGDSQTQQVNVRVLAATNRDLPQEVAQGRFRNDLYYRLAVVPIAVPPLRERCEDIPELVEHFLAKSTARSQCETPLIDDSAQQLLAAHDWPGNVRELENIITRACVLFAGRRVSADDLRPWLSDSSGESHDDRCSPLHGSLQDVERRLIESTLEKFHGHRAKTAQALGIGVRTLTNKLRSYGYAPREKSFTKHAA